MGSSPTFSTKNYAIAFGKIRKVIMRVLFYDLEVSRTVAEGYGNRWDFKVIKFVRPQELMCYAYKVQGESKTHFVGRHDFKTYKEFVQSLHTLLDSADVTVAHNGGSFDDKMANRFFVVNGLTPPRPRKSIDTKREAKRWFRFESNSLDDLGDFLGVGRKEKVGYSDLEDDYMTSNPKKNTIRAMKKYNIQDITLLEQVYNKLRPWMQSHPNAGDINQANGICPKCSSSRLQKRGFNHRRSGMVQRYQCQSCYGWASEASIKRNGRIVNGT